MENLTDKELVEINGGIREANGLQTMSLVVGSMVAGVVGAVAGWFD